MKIWLDYSNETISDFPKPSVDSYTSTFVMHACEELEVEKDVYFMSIDMIGKYLNIVRRDKITIKEPILTVVILIFICNKLVGQRSNMSISLILSFLRRSGLKKQNKTTIENCEILVMNILKFDFPLCSTMDDMNILIEVFLKSSPLKYRFRAQCLDVLNLLYLHFKTVTDILDEIYSKEESTAVLLRKLYETKLYFPAGVLLCTITMCEGIKSPNFDNASANIAKFTHIEEKYLKLLATVIYKLVHSIIKTK